MRAILFQMVLDFLFYLKDKEWKRDRDLILSFPPQIINIQGGAKPKWSTENSVWISPKMAGTHLLAPSLAASQGAHQKENVVRIRNRTQSINMLMWHTSISGGMLCIVPNISVLDPFFFSLPTGYGKSALYSVKPHLQAYHDFRYIASIIWSLC